MGSPELRGQKLAVAGAHRPVGDDDRVAFVLNLAPETTSEAVEALLGTCGTIKSVRIPLDRHTSQPRVCNPPPPAREGAELADDHYLRGVISCVTMHFVDFCLEVFWPCRVLRT